MIVIRVGVAEARIAVGGTAVDVKGIDVTVGSSGEDVGVGKTWTEKLQALSNNVVNTKTIINRNHLRCLIAFSLSAVDWWFIKYL